VTDSAHLAALKMLARRELSEAQVRTRLARLGHDLPSIDAAIERLRSDRSLDDARVARAIARTESGVRKRGRLRVRQRLAAAGIAGGIADRAVEEVFAQVDEEEMLRAALDRRLGGRPRIADRRELGRLYRHLVGRGFDRDRVMTLLQSLPLES
jgi:regulatory protein